MLFDQSELGFGLDSLIIWILGPELEPQQNVFFVSPQGISLKVNVIARLEIELAYYVIAAQHVRPCYSSLEDDRSRDKLNWISKLVFALLPFDIFLSSVDSSRRGSNDSFPLFFFSWL